MTRSFSIGEADEFAGFVHQQTAAVISAMDVKASILLTLATGALAVMADRFVADFAVAPIRETIALLGWREGLPAVIAVAAFVGSFLASIVCVWPRSGGTKEGIVFFRGISQFSAPERYSAAVLASDPQERTAAVLEDAYKLADVASKKMRRVGLATQLLGVGLVALIALLALGG